MLVEFGGGTDFLKNGQKQIDKCAQGIINVMRCMGMLEGEIEHETDKVQICKGYDAEVWSGTHAGIALRDCDFEDYLEEGDPFASFYNPFTGEKVGEVKAPRSGIVLNTGLQWPKVDQNQWLGVLGEVVDEVSLDDEDLMWD
jgi:predicted deacylase